MADLSSNEPPGALGLRMGDIFVVDWNPGRGSEQIGERPALIVLMSDN